MAKSPIVADRIKLDELDEAVPPKSECWESSILKLSDDKLVPFETSAKPNTGQMTNNKTVNRTKYFLNSTLFIIAKQKPELFTLVFV
ncbi:MAG: hypothetical protein A2816_03295 [Candidatus Yanofskybacteria bacterium RIFCSPHIGHO2_01_FULL_39_44]|nr:MAG: hypothetical protein A2816_03295 [Candidatus Yanofskybacteria bacterium RIFCSPHIGHO2_01_FULL_39_44]OGN20620.1 MAG: hypothetical protein A2910_02395 [Candidatus Yanofskybacteria bacterium RIFCSPLOWO2_01_FULL_39_28]